MTDQAVLLTRPAGAPIARTANYLQAHGLQVIRMPLIGIQPPRRTPAMRQREAAARADAWIFTSRNAVEMSRELLPHAFSGRIFAIGPSTAQACLVAGWSAEPVAPGQNSESLLAEQVDLSGKIIIIGGSGGRRQLKQQLLKRGCDVEKMIVYRREALAYSAQALRRAIEKVPVLVFSSGHAMRVWHGLVTHHRLPAALDLPLLVASTRLCKLARQLGFSQPATALPQMSDSALLKTLNERKR